MRLVVSVCCRRSSPWMAQRAPFVLPGREVFDGFAPLRYARPARAVGENIWFSVSCTVAILKTDDIALASPIRHAIRAQAQGRAW